jgi:integrase
VLRCHIDKRDIGKRPLVDLKPAHVQQWITDLQKAQLAPATIRGAHARLRKALDVAVRLQHVSSNVAEVVILPKVEAREIAPLDFDQVRTLLAAVEGHRWEALYRLAVNLGMREAELLGLTVAAVDLQAGTIHVRQQLQRTRDTAGEEPSFRLQSLKSAGANRLLRLDEDLILVVQRHLERRSAEKAAFKSWPDTLDLVFTSHKAKPIHHANLLHHFQRVLKRCGLPCIRFHDLRHTAATLMLAIGEPLVNVSKVLGHSSPAITARIYAHALDEGKADAIAGLSARLRNAGVSNDE